MVRGNKTTRHSLGLTVLVSFLIAFCLLAKPAPAEPTFFGLGDLRGSATVSSEAVAVSADGSTVVGRAATPGGSGAFRWSASTGMLPASGGSIARPGDTAIGVSGDGTFVVSAGPDRSPIYWTGGGWGIPFAIWHASGILSLSPHSLSADGRTVVGSATTQSGLQAFRWSPNGVVRLLGTMPGGGATSAMDVNEDGTVIVGSGVTAGDTGSLEVAFRWTQADGFDSLGLLEGGSRFTRATAVSSDGNLIAGEGDTGGTDQAFLWTIEDGMRLLGEFTPQGLADDGSLVVGTRDFDQDTSRAVIWDEVYGVRDLKLVLELDFGLDLAGWILLEAPDVSIDGTVIVGRGINPSGHYEAYVAIVPDPNCLHLILAGVVVVFFRKRQGRGLPLLS